MAFLSIDKTRWRDHLQAWWEEYYLDNPLVWALQRGAVHRLSDKMHISSNSRVLPLWTRRRTLWAFFWWMVALLGVCAMQLTPTLSQQANQWLEQALTPTAIGITIGFINTGSVIGFLFNPMVGFLNVLRESNQLTAVGMTRLRGAHVVYGSVLHSWMRGTLMRSLIAYYPLLWLIHTVVSDNPLAALFTAAAGVLLGNAIVLVLLLIMLSALPVQLPVREAGAGKASSGFDNAISLTMIAGLLTVPVGLVVIFFMAKMYLLTLLTPVVWLFVGLLRLSAVRRAERILRSKEPEIVPSEGRWQ